MVEIIIKYTFLTIPLSQLIVLQNVLLYFAHTFVHCGPNYECSKHHYLRIVGAVILLCLNLIEESKIHNLSKIGVRPICKNNVQNNRMLKEPRILLEFQVSYATLHELSFSKKTQYPTKFFNCKVKVTWITTVSLKVKSIIQYFCSLLRLC